MKKLTYYNVKQVLSLFKRHDEIIDLPQLAYFSRQGKITPAFGYTRYAFYIADLKSQLGAEHIMPFNGYLTSHELLPLLDEVKEIKLRKAEVLFCSGDSVKGESILLIADPYYSDKYLTDLNYDPLNDPKNYYSLTLENLLFSSIEIDNLIAEITNKPTNPKILEALEDENNTLKEKINQLEKQSIPHQSYRAIDRILYALVKLSEKDNTKPYSQNRPSLNAEISTILDTEGLSIGYETIGKWLARANDVK